MTDRNISFEKISNARDMGGLRTIQGRIVSSGLLIRSANLSNAAKAERYYQMMLSAGKTKTEAETIRDIFLAKEEYLNAAFSAMDVQYENADAFLRDGLNIPQKLIERFQGSVL